ncbi:MAG TPA: tetraacyldisaccharide 4'-kinase [Burkholderiaceae bacterium]|nr:tetraacyldisaccharide 4'-kinase [Burkholderiaceae bacterium]
MSGSVRTRIERWLTDGWMRRGVVYWAFLDVSALAGWIARRRRRAFVTRRRPITRMNVPVVIVGNLVAGGVGKTPVVIALAQALAARGRTPGVITRGYGGKGGSELRLVDASSDPAQVGDEPVLIARAACVPVAVHAERARAAAALLEQHPDVDVLISDDGLQHYAIDRDVELVVYDARGAGNGRPLPAGPLREPVDRPRDATLFIHCPIDPRLTADAPAFSIPLAVGTPYSLADATRLAEPDFLKGRAVSAYAGLGRPEKFFATLKECGATVDAHPLSDHHVFNDHSFDDAREATIVITEKDAVKCARLSALRHDARIWVLPVRALLPEALIDFVLEKLDGSQAA